MNKREVNKIVNDFCKRNRIKKPDISYWEKDYSVYLRGKNRIILNKYDGKETIIHEVNYHYLKEVASCEYNTSL